MSAEYAHELEDFCNRWKKDVFAFCRMLLGDGAAAEEVTCAAFVAFYRESGLQMSDRKIPPRLLGLALRATEKYRDGCSQRSPSASRLEDAIQCLPRLEQAVVVMRNLLHMEWASLALVADLSPAQAHEAWRRGIFQLNDLLQGDIATKEHH